MAFYNQYIPTNIYIYIYVYTSTYMYTYIHMHVDIRFLQAYITSRNSLLRGACKVIFGHTQRRRLRPKLFAAKSCANKIYHEHALLSGVASKARTNMAPKSRLKHSKHYIGSA